MNSKLYFVEKLTKKCMPLRNAIGFNKTCLNNGILTKYCHIMRCMLQYIFYINNFVASGCRLRFLFLEGYTWVSSA